MGAAAVFYATLAAKYREATSKQVLEVVVHALNGARVMGVDLLDPVVLVTAEAELRRALGIDDERSRLDPEPHVGARGKRRK